MPDWTTTVSVADLEHHLKADGIRIFDARFNLQDADSGYQQYLQAHIPGSQYVHLDRDLSGPILPGETGRHPLPAQKVLTEKLCDWGVSNNDQVIIYDQGHGGLAARMWWLLKWLGHTRVGVLDGGWDAWLRSGSVTTTDHSSYAPGDFAIRPSAFTVKTVGDVSNDIEEDDQVLIDARAANRYLGLEEPLDPVAGHIPGAVNRPFLDNIGEDGFWKSKKQLEQEWADLMPSPEVKPTMYCGSGVTACHNILALCHIGKEPPALYAGSWSEWIVDLDRPMILSHEA